MSKLGITLPALALVSLVGPAYEPRRYSPKTYDRRIGEPDRITNMEQAWLAQLGVPAGCTGVAQTITSTGITLFTAGCTGTLNFSEWGAGGGGAGSGSTSKPGGGGGGFAKSALSVTSGEVIRLGVPVGGLGKFAAGGNGPDAFACRNANTDCSNVVFPWTSVCLNAAIIALGTANVVCAEGGHGGTSGNPAGGSTSVSIGVTLFAGGNGGAGSSAHCGGGGGGSAGPDGAGVAGGNATASGTCTGTTGKGGTADNGSGGAGGAQGSGTGPSGTGTSNVNGGGGGGGSDYFQSIGVCTPGDGGVPGGGGGGNTNYYASCGGKGQAIIHSMLDLPEDGVIGGYTPCGGGTVSMS